MTINEKNVSEAEGLFFRFRQTVGAAMRAFGRRLVPECGLPESSRTLRVVHLPVYPENSYQPLLMEAERKQGWETIEGGGGGNFFRTALLDWQADVLHLHWLHPYLLSSNRFASVLRSVRFLLEIGLLKIAGYRVVWTMHNLKNHDNRHLAIERNATRLFCMLADRVIVHCGCAAREAASIFDVPEEKLAVIPHANYAGAYPDVADRATARNELSISASATTFLFLGRICPYKGVMDLVSAFARLDAPDARLVIAGQPSGELTPQLRHAIAAHPSIIFAPGYVPAERIALYMNAADVVVFPYREVLTSGALLLAMSFAKAAIAPARGCIPETIDPAGGLLYRSDDPRGLESAMRQMLSRREQFLEMGRRNRIRSDAWSWDVIAAKTVETYSSQGAPS